MTMPARPEDSCRWTSESGELAGGIDAGPAAQIHTSGASSHHSLLNGRIVRLTPRLWGAYNRGKKDGVRHFSGLVNWRRANVAWLLLPRAAISPPPFTSPDPPCAPSLLKSVTASAGHGYLRLRRPRRERLRPRAIDASLNDPGVIARGSLTLIGRVSRFT